MSKTNFELLEGKKRELTILKNTLEKEILYIDNILSLKDIGNDDKFVHNFIKAKKYCEYYDDDLIKQINDKFTKLPADVIYRSCSSALIGSGYKTDNFLYNLLDDYGNKQCLSFIREFQNLKISFFMLDEYTIYSKYNNNTCSQKDNSIVSIYRRNDHHLISLVFDAICNSNNFLVVYNSPTRHNKLNKNTLSKMLCIEDIESKIMEYVNDH